MKPNSMSTHAFRLQSQVTAASIKQQVELCGSDSCESEMLSFIVQLVQNTKMTVMINNRLLTSDVPTVESSQHQNHRIKIPCGLGFVCKQVYFVTHSKIPHYFCHSNAHTNFSYFRYIFWFSQYICSLFEFQGYKEVYWSLCNKFSSDVFFIHSSIPKSISWFSFIFTRKIEKLCNSMHLQFSGFCVRWLMTHGGPSMLLCFQVKKLFSNQNDLRPDNHTHKPLSVLLPCANRKQIVYPAEKIQVYNETPQPLSKDSEVSSILGLINTQCGHSHLHSKVSSSVQYFTTPDLSN